jgi:hypothetical protein
MEEVKNKKTGKQVNCFPVFYEQIGKLFFNKGTFNNVITCDTNTR